MVVYCRLHVTDAPVASTGCDRILLCAWMSGLGDILLLLPAVRALRAAFPTAFLTLAVRGEPARLYESWGLVDRAFSIELMNLVEVSPLSDVVVVFTGNDPLRSAIRHLRPDALLSDPRPPAGVHTAEWLLSALSPLGIHANWTGPQAVAPVVARTNNPRGPIILHPGSGATWKCPPVELFEELAVLLTARGYPVAVLEGPAERERATRFDVRAEILREPTLQRLAEYLTASSGYVGNDSGVSHLAGLLGVPSVTLFGPTHPSSWSPLGPRVRVIRHCTEPPRTDVRVCHRPDCLHDITAHEVFDQLLDVMVE